MQVNPALLSRALLNQALINNQLKQPKVFNRVPYKPIVKPKVFSPLKPEETLSKLEKLLPELDDADKFTVISKEFIDLLLRGISKETVPKFFEMLQKLSTLIGSPAHNSVALARMFDAAYAKRTLFSTEEIAEISKWKGEVDAKIKPTIFVKRPSDDQFDSNKRQRSNGASVEDILLKRIDTLEDEVSKLRDELSQTKQKYGKDLEQIRAAVGIPAIEVDDEELPDTTTLVSELGVPEAGNIKEEQESTILPNTDLNTTE